MAKSCDGNNVYNKHILVTFKMIEAHSNVSFDGVGRALEMYIRFYTFLESMRNQLSHHSISLSTRIVGRSVFAAATAE
jgi:hypothetical protein